MDRALDLKPEVTGVRIPALAGSVHDNLSKAPNPQLLHLDGLNAENTFHSV